MTGWDRPLTVKVINGELQIAIGIETLAFAAKHSPDNRLCWLDEESGDFLSLDIINSKEFANDVARAIDTEVCNGGDGTTYLHKFLEDAMVRAIEDGSIGVSEKPSVARWEFPGKKQ